MSLNFVSRSMDGGATWEDPVRVRSGKPARANKLGIKGGYSLTVPPTELPDGTLVMPVHCLSSVDRALPEIGLLRSRDSGRTWCAFVAASGLPSRAPKSRYIPAALTRTQSGRP